MFTHEHMIIKARLNFRAINYLSSFPFTTFPHPVSSTHTHTHTRTPPTPCPPRGKSQILRLRPTPYWRPLSRKNPTIINALFLWWRFAKQTEDDRWRRGWRFPSHPIRQHENRLDNWVWTMPDNCIYLLLVQNSHPCWFLFFWWRFIFNSEKKMNDQYLINSECSTKHKNSSTSKRVLRNRYQRCPILLAHTSPWSLETELVLLILYHFGGARTK